MKRRSKPEPPLTYSVMDELIASPTEPLPVAKRTSQLTQMLNGLRSLEQDAEPTTNDWRVCSDCVNLMETLIEQGVIEDASGLLLDAVTALALAGKRHLAGGRLGLSGPGMQAVRAVLEDYSACLEAIPARTIIRAHRATEKRHREILAGRGRAHDVEVMAI